MSWQQPPPPGAQPPPMGFYPGQTGPAPGFYPSQSAGGYPTQGGGGYPSQPGYPPAGFPGQGAGYPGQGAGYPGQGFPPPYGGGQGAPPPHGGIPFAPPPLRPDAMYGGTNTYGRDAEDPMGTDSAFEFSDKSIRRGFIRKVYGILMVQLLVTLGFIAVFTYHLPTKQFVRQNQWMWWLAFALMFVCLITMSCCGDVRRKAPMNFIFLGIFTACEGFMLGMACSFYNAEAVLMAVGICAGVCLALSIFAFQTKWDFTMMGGILFVAVIILLIFGIVAMIFPGKTITLVYASCGAVLFSIYLVYDTQMMIGGTHKYSISPEEYIFAALNLYLDIINIFLYILTIIGASSRD